MIDEAIGPYRVTGKLGEGGMGEVYRARDTKLDRDVAIKILPELLAADPDRLMRFEREAKTLAALNHPYIAQIYGIEDLPSRSGTGASRAIVMELVEGEDLAQRIARGPVPVDEALRIGGQIAEALETAHEAGIIHRDLKPGNIKVRPDGTVKVLDFGLAKALGPPGSAGATDLANSPTFASPAGTSAGMILGTAAYMSPEQARGGAADARSDIWAFGVVLYEMLTGRPLFSGEHVSDVLAAVLRDGPNWDALPAETPSSVRTLLERCLRKDPRIRLRHAGDARLELLEVREPAGEASARKRPSWPLRAALLLAILASLAALYFGLASSSGADVPVRKWIIAQDYAEEYFGRENAPAISPDGRYVAYVDGDRLHLRDLASLDSRVVPGSGVAGLPVWAPDGSAVAFSLDMRSIWRVAPGAEKPVKLGDLPPGIVMGLAWRPDHTIIVNIAYGPTAGELFKLADGGGRAERFKPVANDEAAIFWMRGLPDGSLTYVRLDGSGGRNVLVRPAGTVIDLRVPRHTGLAYAPTGHLVFAGTTTPGIWAVPFDLARGAITGEPFRVAERGTHPTVSQDGTLVYGRTIPGARQLAFVDREGVPRGTIGQPQDSMASPALSPDGRRVAVAAWENGTENIWVHEVDRPIKSRLTFGTNDVDPVWHPSGDRITFQTNGWDLHAVSAEGGEAQPLVAGPLPEFNPVWSRSGALLFGRFAAKTQSDVWLLEPGAEPRPVFEGATHEMDLALSPDGKYLAYTSDETGRLEVFVRGFPGGQGKRQVSSRGGRWASWSSRGDEIYFMEGSTLMAAPVQIGAVVEVGTPRALFPLDARGAELRIYTPVDGQRFIIVRTLTPPKSGIAVVQNWLAEFGR